MTLFISIPLTMILLFSGYVYTVFYFSEEKKLPRFSRLIGISKARLLYCAFSIIACATLICLFELVYKTDIVDQVKLMGLVCLLFPIAEIDFRKQVIPNQLLIAGLIYRVIILAIEYIIDYKTAWTITKDCLIGALVIGVFFLVLLLVFKNSIGMGDVKLFALIGFYQGLWGAINSVFFSLLSSFVIAIFLLLTKKKTRKDTISFGPTILLGTIIAIGLSGM